MRIIDSEILEKFRLYLNEKEQSKNTIEKYMRDIRHFVACAGTIEVKKSDVLDYKLGLCEKYSPKSVNSMLSSLNAFFTFMEWHELKVKTLKIQRQLFTDTTKELTKAEYEKLLITAKNNKKEKLYYLMQTIASTGLRVSEIKYVT